jgi:hypothetical protein
MQSEKIVFSCDTLMTNRLDEQFDVLSVIGQLELSYPIARRVGKPEGLIRSGG